MLLRFVFAGFFAGATAWASLGLGSTRKEVIDHYGPPRGTSQSGKREILMYREGRVVLEDGRVTVLELMLPPMEGASSPPAATPAAAPTAAQAQPPAGNKPVAPARTVVPANPWLTDFDAAKAQGGAHNKRLLVLFTGTDWCPPCQRFQNEVSGNEDFLRIFSPAFVFLKVDWLRNRPQPASEAEQVNALRREYGIASYPTLLVLAADGTMLMRVDTRKKREASSLADFYIQAVDEARHATRDGTPVKSGWWPF